MHCGCEYTAYPIYRDAVAPYSRHTHSLGTAAIVCFPGVMYRGGAEKQIRKCLIDNNFIDCIIQLPDNLFYGTTIATCIMVLLRFLQHPYTSNNRTKPDACRMLC